MVDLCREEVEVDAMGSMEDAALVGHVLADACRHITVDRRDADGICCFPAEQSHILLVAWEMQL